MASKQGPEKTVFWKNLEADLKVEIPDRLCYILENNGYTTLQSLKVFNSAKANETFQDIENLMQTTLHRVFSEDILKLCYGLFSEKPELFVLLPGDKAVMRSIAEKLQMRDNPIFAAKRSSKQVGSGQNVSRNPRTETVEISEEERKGAVERLNSKVQEYFESPFYSIQFESFPKCFDVRSEGLHLEAKLKCPFCSKLFIVNKVSFSWSTPNFYKHARGCVSKRQPPSGYTSVKDYLKDTNSMSITSHPSNPKTDSIDLTQGESVRVQDTAQIHCEERDEDDCAVSVLGSLPDSQVFPCSRSYNSDGCGQENPVLACLNLKQAPASKTVSPTVTERQKAQTDDSDLAKKISLVNSTEIPKRTDRAKIIAAKIQMQAEADLIEEEIVDTPDSDDETPKKVSKKKKQSGLESDDESTPNIFPVRKSSRKSFRRGRAK